MFSLVYGVLFRGPDVPETDRLAVIARVDTRTEEQNPGPMPNQDFFDLRERSRSFEGILGYFGGTVNLAGEEAPERFQGVFVTANTFDVLRVKPVLGRTFLDGEDRPGLPPTVVLGYHVWRDRYGSDPAVLGRSVRVNGKQGTVVGVMPEGFKWPSNHDLWVTMDDDPSTSARAQGRSYLVMGRLAPGVTWEQGGLDVARIAAQLETEHPEENKAITTRLVTVSEQ